jgi:cytochrome P450
MAAYPDVQRKVQKEIDEKIGRGQIPSVKESLELEYLGASWKESLRMTPPVPLGKYNDDYHVFDTDPPSEY